MAAESALPAVEQPRARGSALEVLLVFLRLGCTSFGGPVAHLGYFQRELVERRRWCTQATLAEVIALAQSLPGPASSQVGFALGILRAGWPGGLAAWTGFTLPSAILMLAFAYGYGFAAGGRAATLIHGLQLVAVAVVAQAVLSMQRMLAPDRLRFMLALTAAALTLLVSAKFSTLLAIAVGAAAGLALFRSAESHAAEPIRQPLSRISGLLAAAAFLVLLVVLPLLARFTGRHTLAVVSAFYRSGAVVFGGGHVVLPLLEGAVVSPGWVSQPSFLAGYGAAQALPGPLFTFGAYLGAQVRPTPSPLLYGILGLIGIFLPGLLAMAAILPFWSSLRSNRLVRAALTGINASVVGILIATLYQPLWTTAVRSAVDFWIALVAFSLLTLWKVQPWIVVLGVAALSLLLPHL